jgi:hypothetical protein
MVKAKNTNDPKTSPEPLGDTVEIPAVIEASLDGSDSEYTRRYAAIRNFTRGAYDIQHTRIQTGNRICAMFLERIGHTNTPNALKPEEGELGAEAAKLLKDLHRDYLRVTDGVISEGDKIVEAANKDLEEETRGKMPTVKKFKPYGHIQTYADLAFIDQYLSLLATEKSSFENLKKALVGIPIYDEFLSKVDGIGPALAGVIISEINIARAEYPSSLHAYAGLDVVPVGIYYDDKNEKHIVPAREIDAFYSENTPDVEFFAEGKYKIQYTMVGRSNKDYCLVDREYIDKEGKTKTRRSITYNPWLKTKLVGVAMGSFLKRNYFTVDGERASKSERLAMAIKEGLVLTDEKDTDDQVIEFLRKSHVVEKIMSPYAKAYYGYRQRLDRKEEVRVGAWEHEFRYNPEFKSWTKEQRDNVMAEIIKTPNHKHRMASRYAIKIFLNDLYRIWRKLEGLEVAPTYEEAKLGKVHGKAGTMGLPAPRFYIPEFERVHHNYLPEE